MHNLNNNWILCNIESVQVGLQLARRKFFRSNSVQIPPLNFKNRFTNALQPEGLFYPFLLPWELS